MLLKGVLATAYFYIYENWRMYEFAWDSLTVWILAALLTDLGYYWVHRAAHGNFAEKKKSLSKMQILFLLRNQLSLGGSSSSS